MSIVIALKTDDWAVLGADHKGIVTLVDGDTFSTKMDKIVGIGNNTIFGFTGNTKNINDLINLLRKNSIALDKDLLGSLRGLRREIRKVDINIQSVFCGVSGGNIDLVELLADKSDRKLEIESLHMDNDVVGETIIGLNTMNSIINPYLEYAKKVGKKITVEDAEFLVYAAIASISDSGIQTVGGGVTIWELKKESGKVHMAKVPDPKVYDFFDSGYRLYKKKSILSMEESLQMLRGFSRFNNSETRKVAKD
ncbi:MAG: hypothetical protein ACP5MX_00025 [Candidatus Micrarchaeia archaeon]